MFEGIDGSGKSTQVKLLAENLRQTGLTAVLTSEPSIGPVGRKIRSLVKRLAPEEEVELFTEDRKDHVKSLILPALFAPQPDITFFLDLTPEAALTRITQGRQESLSPFEDLENLGKVAELYAFVRDSSFVIIDASQDPATVQASIWRAVEKHLKTVSNI